MYDISFLDDIHNFFPAFLYDQQQFITTRDVFGYVNRQMDVHFNIFNRAQREYNQQHPRMPTVNTQPPLRRRADNFDMTPVYTTTQNLNGISDLLAAMLITPPVQQTMEPVIVRPTRSQIDRATTLHLASVDDEDLNCSICQETYTEQQSIRLIRHCSHKFHRECIDTWFNRNVHCPVCRHDIREVNQNV